MAEFGQAAIWLAVFSSSWAVTMLVIGLRLGRHDVVVSGRNGSIATFALISIAVFALIYAFVTDDFSIQYVVEGSSLDQPLLYKITALWGRMSGSLLFWLWLLTLCGAIVVWQNRNAQDYLADYATIPISIVSLFFAILVSGLIKGVENPLARLPNGMRMPDGRGMNPLLQTPSMAFHPPTLYIGFVSLTVPFAFAIGSLIGRQNSNEWIRRSRRWTIFSWLALMIGIAMGGNWAYRELGWGGYWAWDPVENASLMPWLLNSAFLHSIMMQERRNMLKLWNTILITLAFEFTLIGTFITRSGVITSVHAFAQSNIGPYFMSFIIASTFAVAILIVWRWDDLRSRNQLESLISRESAFVLNNWVLVGLTLIVLWGTLWPIISEAISDQKTAVPEEFFNKTVIIPSLILLFLTGAGPIISWKKLTISNLKRVFVLPTIIGAISILPTIAILIRGGNAISTSRSIYTFICVFLSIFVLVAIFDEFYRGAKLRSKRRSIGMISGFFQLIWRNKRRYGGYIVHIGLVIVYVGILGSKGYDLLESKSLTIGESMIVGDYKFTMGEGSEKSFPNFRLAMIDFEVEKNGRKIGTMKPARAFFHKTGQGDQDTIESAIRHLGLSDLYIALGPIPPKISSYVSNGGKIPTSIYYNPLINLVWLGVAIMLGGGVLSMIEK